MSEKNLKLWNAVTKTDPAHTKHVGTRGGFTAIDAYYQIQNATAQFGPVGQGWGWSIKQIHDLVDTVVVEIEMWHTDQRENAFDVLGQAAKHSGDRVDGDSAKKALTDGITKGLSYLGFNTDVFLGKFDNNKYVEGLQAEKREAEVPQEQREADQVAVNDFINTITDLMQKNAAAQAVEKIISDFNPSFKEIGSRSKELGSVIRAAVKEVREDLVK